MRISSRQVGGGFRLALTVAMLALLVPGIGSAAAPHCHVHDGQGYCQYDGKVRIAYMNAYQQIILYFDTAMPPTAPGSVGITGVSVFDAAIYPTAENPDFAKALYASLLSAQARGATIQVQLWGTNAGYLKIDRIWVHQE